MKHSCPSNSPLYNIRCKVVLLVKELKNIIFSKYFLAKSLVVIIFCPTFALAFTAGAFVVPSLGIVL